MHAQSIQQGARGPCILAGNTINLAENGPSALAQVGQIADRRSDHVEMPRERFQRCVFFGHKKSGFVGRI
jgi:hypothetical protein